MVGTPSRWRRACYNWKWTLEGARAGARAGKLRKRVRYGRDEPNSLANRFGHCAFTFRGQKDSRSDAWTWSGGPEL